MSSLSEILRVLPTDGNAIVALIVLVLSFLAIVLIPKQEKTLRMVAFVMLFLGGGWLINLLIGTEIDNPQQGRIILTGETANDLDGVKLPSESDATYSYGADTLLDRWDGNKVIPPASDYRFATWEVVDAIPGEYLVTIVYAEERSRPLQLLIDGQVVLENLALESTGGRGADDREEKEVGSVSISNPNFTVRLQTMTVRESWPHFYKLRLVKKSD